MVSKRLVFEIPGSFRIDTPTDWEQAEDYNDSIWIRPKHDATSGVHISCGDVDWQPDQISRCLVEEMQNILESDIIPKCAELFVKADTAIWENDEVGLVGATTYVHCKGRRKWIVKIVYVPSRKELFVLDATFDKKLRDTYDSILMSFEVVN